MNFDKKYRDGKVLATFFYFWKHKMKVFGDMP